MRHRNVVKIIGRKKAPRDSLMKNLAESVVLYEKVKTTETKAKMVKPIVEKAITIGKVKSLTSKRELMKFFYTDLPVKKILEVLGPKYKERKGGYTRIVKIGHRFNDGADMVQIELV